MRNVLWFQGMTSNVGLPFSVERWATVDPVRLVLETSTLRLTVAGFSCSFSRARPDIYMECFHLVFSESEGECLL
jgi:hypothetical protein